MVPLPILSVASRQKPYSLIGSVLHIARALELLFLSFGSVSLWAILQALDAEALVPVYLDTLLDVVAAVATLTPKLHCNDSIHLSSFSYLSSKKI